MKVTTKGGGNSKWAKFFNSLLSGSLGRLLKAGSGIVIKAHGNDDGVTISATGARFACFELQANKNVSGAHTTPVSGLPVEPGGFTPDSDAVSHDIYFDYAPGFYFADTVVRCEWIGDRWQVMSPAQAGNLTAVLVDNLTDGNDSTVAVSGLVGGGNVEANNTFNLEGVTDDVVQISWHENVQYFVINARICEA